MLEATVASEIEHTMYHQHGLDKTAGNRPISWATASPIEIISEDGGESYDARIKLNVHTFSHLNKSKDEYGKIQRTIEQELKKHYNVKLKSLSDMEVVLEIKDAHLVEQTIRDGATDTVIHTWAAGFGDALRYTKKLLWEWDSVAEPAMKEEYLQSLNRGKEDHFGALGAMISGEEVVVPDERKFAKYVAIYSVSEQGSPELTKHHEFHAGNNSMAGDIAEEYKPSILRELRAHDQHTDPVITVTDLYRVEGVLVGN